MRGIILSLVAAVGAGLLTVVPVRAHHAFASEFDKNLPIKVTGAIARLDWTNPHAWIHVDVKTASGQVERWMFELGSPSAIVRRGFTKDHPALKPGTEIRVEGFLSKGVPRRANARSLTYLADGSTMFVGSAGTGAPDDGNPR